MRRLRSFSLVLALLLFVSRGAQAADSVATVAASHRAALAEPRVERLPNGLQIAWFEAPTLPIIDLVLLLPGGQRRDPRGRSGASELMLALLDREPAGRPAVEFARELEGLGGSRFASVDEDALTIGVHGLAPDASQLLKLLGQLALQPGFSQRELDRERAKLRERWLTAIDSSDAMASLGLSRLLTRGTPYARGSLSESSELAQVRLEDVQTLYRDLVRPERATLAVVGRFNSELLSAEIRRVFGEWKGAAGLVSRATDVLWIDPRLPRVAPGEMLLIDLPGASQVQVRYGFRSVSARNPDRGPLAILNAALGEYFESRLNQRLRDELALTYGAESGFGFAKEFGKFVASTSTRNETVVRVVTEMRAIIEGLRSRQPMTEREFTTAREYLMGKFPLSVATPQGVAIRWLTGVAYDLGPHYLNEFLSRIETATLAQVREAAARHLLSSNAVWTLSGDAKKIEPELRKAGFVVRTISARTLVR